MQVKTMHGYRAIQDINPQDYVYTLNELTGSASFQKVLAHYSNNYDATVYIGVKDQRGNQQTIVSNKIHPFFTIAKTGTPPSSEGHSYKGHIQNGQWVDAANLTAGDQLLGSNNQWQQIISVTIKAEPLKAFNLTVDQTHTYFIKGVEAGEGVWVHNNCNSAFINDIIKSQKIAPDLMVKGVHFNVGRIELKALPDNNGGLVFKSVFSSSNPSEVQNAIVKANVAMQSPAFREFLIKHADAGFTMASQNGNAKALEFKMLKLALERF